MENIKLTDEFNLAYRFITETKESIFLTGKAGTGKTTFLKYIREHCTKKMAIAAPTGVAAINAGGVTLHSLFQLPFAPFIPTMTASKPEAVSSNSFLSQIHFRKKKLTLLRNLELLVIDETSMVTSHTIDAIDTILRNVRNDYTRPFGGLQILFIGDLHQLPPVVKQEEWHFLKDYYSSIFFFDSKVLQENIPIIIELKEIFRQKDSSFIEILNGIRNNTLSEEHVELLNSRLNNEYNSEDYSGYITLTTHNHQSDSINKRSLNNLSGEQYTFQAKTEGTFPEHVYPADELLGLKEGAQIMFLKNDTENKEYFNGKIGVVTYLGNNTIKVRCSGESHEIEVKKHVWKNISYSFDSTTRQLTEVELGSFVQYPIRLAWAITIHKSQGLTFDKLIVDAQNAFAYGQVYVALSRCTTLDGLVLRTPINYKFLGAEKPLMGWIKENYDENRLQYRFDCAKHELF